MLEEALKAHGKNSSSSSNQSSPAEVALVALQFIQSQLPAGGISAENRFFRLYVPLCNVIFGPIIIPDSSSSSSSNNVGCYRHEDGGWMSAREAWSRPTTTAFNSAGGNNRRPPQIMSGTSSSNCQSDPVYQLLGGISNCLIDAIAKESAKGPAAAPGFPLPFHALPKTTRDAWMALVEASLSGIGGQQQLQPVVNNINSPICSPNTSRLLGEMSRRRPAEQTELIEYRQQQVALRNQNYSTIGGSGSSSPPATLGAPHLFQSPMAAASSGFYSPTAAAAATAAAATSPLQAAAAAGTSSNTATTGGADPKSGHEPQVIFGMLEYYLILFLRYPLAVPIPKTYVTNPAPQGRVRTNTSSTTTSSRSLSSSGRRDAVPYGERLYVTLFRKYTHLFLPYDRDENNHRHINISTTTRDSEFFLRATITMWMETQGCVKATSAMVESLLQRGRRHTNDSSSTSGMLLLNLHSSYDLIQVVGGAYDPPPPLIQQGLRYLVAHIILDPTLHAQVFALSAQQQQQQRTAAAAAVGSTASSSSTTNTPSLSFGGSLSTAMMAMQQPFYNIIRINLRYASIHSSESPFFSALNLWLLWLEPWNVKEYKTHTNFSPRSATQRLMGTVSGQQQQGSQQQQQQQPRVQRKLDSPRHDQLSRYHDKWEPYIAANLYLYVVPLAIFLRRARELDFSQSKFQTSMKVVQKVFRVFSPAVVQVLSRHLAEASSSVGPSSSSSFSKNALLLRRHLESLGVHAPPISSSVGSAAASSSVAPMAMTMESCQGDMICLLEEIQMQHLKKVRELDVFERTSAYFEGFFGKGVVSGEEKALASIVERARLIVNLPLDYDLDFSSRSETARANSGSSSEISGLSHRPATTSDGYLTDVGKCQLLTGAVKCNPADIVFHGDTSKARAKSHELVPLLQLTAWASDWIHAQTNCRVDLRFLADYRNLWSLSLLAFILYKCLRYKFAG